MLLAPFILCAFWCAHSPTLGANVLPPHRGALSFAGGINTLLPTLSLDGVAGLAPRVDLRLAYDTHAGLAHVLSATARVRVSRSWALGLAASYGLFVIEELAGIKAARAPFGNGLSLTPSVHVSRLSRGGVALSGSLGVSLRVLRVESTVDGIDRAADASVQDAWAELAAEWEERHGAMYLRARLQVPIQADLHLIGYLPWVVVGRTWDFP